MEKQQLLAELKQQLQEGLITKSELVALTSTSSADIDSAPHKMVSVLYTIGAIIAIVGVIILIAQNWNEIGFVGRIAVTLGISLATFVAGFVLCAPHQNKLSQVMFFISAVLAPIGSLVLIDEADMTMSLTTNVVLAFILAVVYGVAYWATRKNILVLITVGFGSWAYYAVLAKTFESSLFDGDILKWAAIVAGAAYILMARGFATKDSEVISVENNAVAGILYAVGAFSILLAGISFGGFFDVLYIAVLFAGFYGSIFLKSRGVLLLSALFLMIHIGKLTVEYFADSIGWPVALIFIGFVVIAVGYGTLWLNRKFLKRG